MRIQSILASIYTSCGFLCLTGSLWAQPGIDTVSADAVVPSLDPLQGGMSLRQIIETGGWPMYVLGVMSVFGMALVFYYFLVLRQNQVMPAKLLASLRRYLPADQLDHAKEACEKKRSAMSSVSLSAIDYARGVDCPDPALLRDIIEGEGSRQATIIQNQIQYLQDIAVIAPMIGLLGTVMGMLKAFNAVASDLAKATPMVLAHGVSQALITTAAGLIVGIPAMMAYAYFRGRSAKLLAGLEAASTELLTLLVRKS